MRLLILAILSFTLYAADEPPALPADVQSTIDKADKSIVSIQSKADMEATKVRSDLIAALKKAQETYTKKGDLDAAIHIKAQIEDTQKAVDAYYSLAKENTALSPQTVQRTAWKDLPGKIYTVQSVEALTVELDKPSMIVPNPESKWGGGGSKGLATCSWLGYDGRGVGWMALRATMNEQPVDLTKPIKTGSVKLGAEDENTQGNTGSIEVKVVPVKN